MNSTPLRGWIKYIFSIFVLFVFSLSSSVQTVIPLINTCIYTLTLICTTRFSLSSSSFLFILILSLRRTTHTKCHNTTTDRHCCGVSDKVNIVVKWRMQQLIRSVVQLIIVSSKPNERKCKGKLNPLHYLTNLHLLLKRFLLQTFM